MTKEKKLYPLKFDPILKNKIWGGSKLKEIYNRKTDSDKLGESWELSGYKGDESVVVNGFLSGNNLAELVEVYMGDLVGDKIYDKFGTSFPLLFKLIDADDYLSIQVHPNDEVALERHNSFGKTEMWYVVDAIPNGELIIGFKEDCTKEKYVQAVNDGKVEDLLQSVPAKKGDVFFIPAGLVHAIGKGVIVAEIQETSDITYRIYDYKRTDENGKERELHTEQALDVINFSASKKPKTDYTLQPNEATTLVDCEFFTTNIIEFDQSIARNYLKTDSFVAYMCLEGSFDINYNGEKTTVIKGDTILIPACIDELELLPQPKAKILEVYIS